MSRGPPELRAAAHTGHRRVGNKAVPFGRYLPRGEPEQPGGEDERPVGTGQHLAEGLDGAAVRVGRALEVPRESEIVLERQVNHAVRRGSGTSQAVEVIESAAVHGGPGRGEGSG